MGVERILSTKAFSVQDGLLQLSVDTGQASSAHQNLRLEASWKETVRVVRQEEVRHGSLPIVLDGILNQLPDVEDELKKIADNIKNETENNFQIYEIVVNEKEMLEKNSKNNRLAALFHNKHLNNNKNLFSAVSDVDVDTRRILYSLVVFISKIAEKIVDVIRVDVNCEVTPSLPQSILLISNTHMLRWRALLSLESDLQQPPRQAVALMGQILTWRLSAPPPPLVVSGKSVGDLRLEGPPSVTRLANGLVGVQQSITELANCGQQGEKEILTRLEDAVVKDGGWETQIHHIWTVPSKGRFQYHFVVFLKGGAVYKSSIKCLIGPCGEPTPDNESENSTKFLEKDHLDMLKLTALLKLKEEYKDISVRIELPGGRDVSRVTLPNTITSGTADSQGPPQAPKKSKSRNNGFLGMFKNKDVDPQPPNNLNISTNKNVETYLDSIENVQTPPTIAPPTIQRQHTLIDSDPQNFQSILGNDDPAKVTNSLNYETKESLKVPVTDIFPDKLTEQKYQTKKTNIKEIPPRKNSTSSRKSPARKMSTCLEPHEPIGDSLPVPVPISPSPRPSLSRNISECSNFSYDSKGPSNDSRILERRNTLVAFKDAISDSGRKLSMMVSDNQQRALESLLADLHGGSMSPRRKALYSLFFFFVLVALYWGGFWLFEHLLTLRDSLTGHLERMSATQSSQMYELNKRLENVEKLVTGLHNNDISEKLEMVLTQLKDGAEGNTLKVTVMERLVSELGGIETALVSLQDQVTRGLSCGWSPFSTEENP